MVEEKKRGWLLSTWLILMLIVNGALALLYLLGAGFIISLTKVPLWAIYSLGVVLLLNMVFTISLFRWKKWAFFAICGTGIISMVINISIKMNIANIVRSIFSPIISIGILYLIMRPKWNLFE